ncbi:AcrR family transcriptional regulator [Kitasatospora sp. GP30]|uniref:TetR/AcrR family transcriptional regulator n=1 Tax=Kitasatospora sp. GP30 TaxID=3035084 RepID=UPI000C703AF7|nr:TetR/AcrR family transcriptional regulator [Kitasatospora sp. GP30]MDH6139619.1 AcrR family transcriptional regulator [Kitasatospora sp. GP30]
MSAPESGTAVDVASGVAPARPMRADARRNYERLVSAAAEAFAERGERASMDEIAKRAGVGAGTLYRHFPAREDLVAVVYRGGLEETCAKGRALLAEREPGDALYAWLEVMALHWRAIGELRTLMSAVFAERGDLKESCHDLIFGMADELIDDAKAAGTVRGDLTAPEALRLVHATVVACESKPGTVEVALERMLELVTDGLRPRD